MFEQFLLQNATSVLLVIDCAASGLLVVAKTNEAHEELVKQFKEHSVTRRYVCIVFGAVK
jgi:23S rRNA pseudouridine1911/1915/1917 synthase